MRRAPSRGVASRRRARCLGGALGSDPGDRALLELAESQGRVLITIDTDFGELIYLHDVPHAGLVRLPERPAEQRIALMSEVIARHGGALAERAVVTIRGERIRVSRPPATEL